jgi:hypothetical protein
MADYYKLITRAMAGSGKGTDQRWRTALARARGALVIELCRTTPPLTEAEITRECLLFEEAIREFETKSSHGSLSGAPVPAPHPRHRSNGHRSASRAGHQLLDVSLLLKHACLTSAISNS